MKKTKIEWCDSTWNPVTGCLHGCEYCYAHRIATRFGGIMPDTKNHVLDTLNRTTDGKPDPYPWGFSPTFHRYKLDEPSHWKKPKNIFVCSMADLFGDWVPDEWIKEVFEACDRAPQHRYLFLTKNPKRYEKVCDDYRPSNMWFGWTQTEPIEITFETHHGTNTFVSLEPLLKPFESYHIQGISWVIIGAETGNRKEKIIPEKWWIDDIVKECDNAGIPVFMKDSLVPIMGEENMRREFPWEAPNEK